MEHNDIVNGVRGEVNRGACRFRNAFRLSASDFADVGQVESFGFGIDGDFDHKSLIIFKIDAVAFGHVISAFDAIVQIDGHSGGLRCEVENQSQDEGRKQQSALKSLFHDVEIKVEIGEKCKDRQFPPRETFFVLKMCRFGAN